MRYCIKCGVRLPEDPTVQFCPNCGFPVAGQLPRARPFEPITEPRRAPRIASFRTRILVLLVAFVLCFAITASGAVSAIGASEAQDLTGQFNNLDELLNTAGLEFIFGNNLKHCLIMFVPGAGPFYGGFVLYSTGRVLAALGETESVSPLALLVALFIYPHAWLEYVSYSLAISESFWLVFALVKFGLRGFRGEVSTAAKTIAVCAVLLLLAAFAEMYIISLMSA